MASSRVMPSSSSAAKSDLVRPPPSMYPLKSAAGTNDPDPPPSSLSADFPAGSANMDDLLRNFYVETEAQAPPPLPARDGAGKTSEEVWKEIAAAAAAAGRATAGSDGPPPTAAYGAMTLEDFLSRAGAVSGEDVRVPPSATVPAGFGVDPMVPDPFVPQEQRLVADNPILGFGNGVDGGGGVVGGGGRGWKRAIVDPVDKAALQRQKRMIKNRESAARSRERKQAYTVELESLVLRLEEENASLLREQEEHHKMSLQHLMDNLIPVTEMKKPPRVLRRTHSM